MDPKVYKVRVLSWGCQFFPSLLHPIEVVVQGRVSALRKTILKELSNAYFVMF